MDESRISSAARQPLAATLVLLAGTIFLTWRAVYGFDLRDGSYAVALGQRLARGDVPFVDELSPHMLGALPMVPVVSLWELAFGSEGIVLVSRLAYVGLAALLGVVSWRALAPVFGGLPTAVAVLAGVLALPYNIQVVSYNTSPQLLLLLATAAGLRAVVSSSALWASVASVAAAGASITYVAVLPSAVVILAASLLLMTRTGGSDPREAASARWIALLVVPGLVLGLLFVTWVLLVPGADALRTAYEAQADRPGGIGLRAFYWHFIAGAKLLPICFLLTLSAVLAPVPGWARGLLLAAAAAALGLWGGTYGPPEIEPSQGRYAGAVSLAVVVLMGLPLLAWTCRRGDRSLQGLALVALPAGAVGAVLTSAVTLSGAAYGAYAVPLSGAVLFVVLSVWHAASGYLHPLGGLIPVTAVTVAFAASLTAVIFDEGAFLHLKERINQGPGAGLVVGDRALANYGSVQALVEACPSKSDGLLSLWVPGAYLWWEGRGAPQYWIGPVESEAALAHIERMNIQFDCVLAPSSLDQEGMPPEFAAILQEEFRAIATEPLIGVGADAAEKFAMYQRLDGQD